MQLRTPICDLFGIDYPIVLAGMGGASGPELAAAVSNAGGLGVLGAAACPPDELDEWIRRTRSLTDRPFGVDTLLPASVPDNLNAQPRSSSGSAGGEGDSVAAPGLRQLLGCERGFTIASRPANCARSTIGDAFNHKQLEHRCLVS